MEIVQYLENRILVLILKDFSQDRTITSLAKELKITRTGIWKALKKLETKKFIVLQPAGTGKTSVYIIKLNWSLLTEKALSLYITEEAFRQPKWLNNFEELEDHVEFLIIYGSILNSPKEANDIDIIGVVANKKDFIKLQEGIDQIQKTQVKKIHAINFTREEFQQELEGKNKAFIEAMKKGVILFGYDQFVQFMKKVHKR